MLGIKIITIYLVGFWFSVVVGGGSSGVEVWTIGHEHDL